MNSNVSQTPQHIIDIFDSKIHKRDTRNRNQLVLPITQKSRTQAAFLFQGIVERNYLSDEIKCKNFTRLLLKKFRNITSLTTEFSILFFINDDNTF